MTDPHSTQSEARGPTPTVAFMLQPIGLVHAAPTRRGRIPKYFAPSRRATLECFHPFAQGLHGLYSGMELWVLTYHPPSGQASRGALQNVDGAQGVFATTSIERPNPIEFLRARVINLDVDKGLLQVEGLDAEDGTPILDIRPAMAPLHRLTKPSY